jgi:hypothetical protein
MFGVYDQADRTSTLSASGEGGESCISFVGFICEWQQDSEAEGFVVCCLQAELVFVGLRGCESDSTSWASSVSGRSREGGSMVWGCLTCLTDCLSLPSCPLHPSSLLSLPPQPRPRHTDCLMSLCLVMMVLYTHKGPVCQIEYVLLSLNVHYQHIRVTS